MRPIVFEQNPLRYPLNELFGTESHIRLLRVLADEVDESLTVSDAAKRAGLTTFGARKALNRLLYSGFIVRVGGGQKHQYRLRRDDKLAQIIMKIFQVEKDRFETLLNLIKTEIETLTPHPFSAWIQDFPKALGDPLLIGVLHDSRYLSKYTHQFRNQLNQVEREFDLTIEMNCYTKADIPNFEAEEIIPLYGVSPFRDKYVLKKFNKTQTHEKVDHRLLLLSRNLAVAIEQDASLIKRAKDHVKRLLQKDQGAANRDISEWREILDSYSIPRLSRFLISSSERANRLRQSNPLFAILSSKERARIINDLEEINDT